MSRIAKLLAAGVLGGGAGNSLLDGLVAYWKLEEASDTRPDASGGGNSLTPVNTPGNAAGIIGNGVSLVAASSQKLTIASPAANFNTLGGSYFWVTWLKPASLAAQMQAIGYGNSTARAYWISLAVDNKYRFISFDVSDGVATAASTVTAQVGVWACVVAWVDVAQMKCFISVNNETPVSANLAALPKSSDGVFYIGSRDTSNYWDGLIDETGFWRGRVPTAAERTQIYNGGSGITYPFLA